ncbi:MAG: Rho termination factor N-terminal domain-containing protein, partial [Cetobacterium sp.]
MEKLEKFLLKDLQEIARQMEIENSNKLKKAELIDLITESINGKEGIYLAWGSLEVMADGYGFLRNTNVEKDVYVSASQIRKFKLRTEDFVVGEVREAVQGENNY